MRRHRKTAGKENHERWLITYSDLITLLLIFFVILYAMSKIDVAKFLILSESLNAALNPSNQIPLNGLGRTALLADQNPTQGDQQAALQKAKSMQREITAINQENRAFSNLYQELEAYVRAHGLSASLTIQDQQRGIQITIRDAMFFRTGEDTLLPQDVVVLQGLVPFLQKLPNQILVEGYTDNVPIDTAQFPSNWELGAGRALAVLEFLAGQGVAPTRLAATSYGQWHPLYSNASRQGRALNRRVNIVILRNRVASLAEANAYTGPPVGPETGSALAAIAQPLGPNKATLLGHNESNQPIIQLPKNIFGPSGSAPQGTTSSH